MAKCKSVQMLRPMCIQMICFLIQGLIYSTRVESFYCISDIQGQWNHGKAPVACTTTLAILNWPAVQQI